MDKRLIVFNFHDIKNISIKTDRFTVSEELFFEIINLISADTILINPNQIDSVQDQNSVLITFDDGFSSHYKIVLPYLLKNKIKAIFFPRVEKLDMPGFLTTKQLMEIKETGNIIGNHTYGHHNLNLMDMPDALHSIVEAEEILKNILEVSNIRYLAVPYGKYNTNILNWVQRNEKFLFTTERRINYMDKSNCLLHRINITSAIKPDQIRKLIHGDKFEWKKQNLRSKLSKIFS